ncbi:hypothetical protein D043_4116B, partial [Vibrio parahaemolyticus EKP-021]
EKLDSFLVFSSSLKLAPSATVTPCFFRKSVCVVMPLSVRYLYSGEF